MIEIPEQIQPIVDPMEGPDAASPDEMLEEQIQEEEEWEWSEEDINNPPTPQKQNLLNLAVALKLLRDSDRPIKKYRLIEYFKGNYSAVFAILENHNKIGRKRYKNRTYYYWIH